MTSRIKKKGALPPPDEVLKKRARRKLEKKKEGFSDCRTGKGGEKTRNIEEGKTSNTIKIGRAQTAREPRKSEIASFGNLCNPSVSRNVTVGQASGGNRHRPWAETGRPIESKIRHKKDTKFVEKVAFRSPPSKGTAKRSMSAIQKAASTDGNLKNGRADLEVARGKICKESFGRI